MNGFGGATLQQDELTQYKCDGSEAVHLKLVRSEEDVLKEETAFHPEFVHQFFENETIFGYRNLKVQLYYHAGSLLTYLGMTHDGELDSSSTGVQPDPVLKIISEYVPPDCMTNLDDFMAKLPSESSFNPCGFGELLHQYTRDDIEYQIYKADIHDKKFQEYHSRFQTFTLWFIDAASFIDLDDERWDCFLLFQKKKEMGNTVYNIVGYMSVYNYFAYPDKVRPRIGQMMTLPPYQKKGHGAQLLETVFQYFIKKPNVLDITVEDPSRNFIQLRDFVDCMACSKLPAFQRDKLRAGFNDEMVKEAREKRKICKQQCRRVYEILKLHVTDLSNPEEYKNYRLEIKNRLNAPFQREKADMEKLRNVLRPDEFRRATLVESSQERLDILDNGYRHLEESYRKTLEKMAAS